MKLVFTPEAEQQADECDTWWRENRDARDPFAREPAARQGCLRESPNVGAPEEVIQVVWPPRPPRLLPKTGTHLYYSVDEDADLVTVLAVWGAPKGRGPKL